MILDCTIRDGGYINNWRFDNEFVQDYLFLCNQLQVDFVEVGFMNKEDKYRNEIVGKYRCLTKEDIEHLYTMNQNLVIMGDYSSINLEELKKIDPNKIKLVRVAFHKYQLHNAIECCNHIKSLGFSVSANVMATNNYTKDELHTVKDLCRNLDYVYIADSYGTMDPKDIESIYTIFQDRKIGLHLHNNLQNAYTNYYYFKDKVDILDTTIFGMGRGAGNLPLELLVEDKYNILYFIEKYIKEIYETQNKWGYDTDYILSGSLKIHPNYVSQLRDLKINSKDRLNILKYIYEHIEYKYYNKDKLIHLVKKFRI